MNLLEACVWVPFRWSAHVQSCAASARKDHMKKAKTTASPLVNRLVPTVVAGLLMISTGAVAVTALAAGVSDEEAKRIALEAVPGVVLGLEREDGEIEVRVRAKDGSIKEVEIDAGTGKVLEVEDDDDDDDDDDD
ncbi:MAG: PepSY domain-containing protein [Polyangiaceae bacterium]